MGRRKYQVFIMLSTVSFSDLLYGLNKLSAQLVAGTNTAQTSCRLKNRDRAPVASPRHTDLGKLEASQLFSRVHFQT
jgi:hypothetical protein